MSSIIKVDTIQLADGTAGTIENLGLATGALSHRNLIINGAMRVAQRGTSTSGLQNGGVYACADRFSYRRGGSWSSVTYTMSQESDAPSGFNKSIKITSSGTETPSSSTHAEFGYFIEGQDVQHLAYETSDAKTITLSFWVKSSLTGKMCVTFRNQDVGKIYATYVTINSADTWEYKTITVSGDTANGFNNNTSGGFRIHWGVACGVSASSVTFDSWVSSSAIMLGTSAEGYIDISGTSGASAQITVVQLEVGSVATPFEHRSYGEELAKCERYYQIAVEGNSKVFGTGTVWSNNAHYGALHFRPMRTIPSISGTTGSGYYRFRTNGSSYNTSTMGFADIHANGCMMYGDGSGGTNGDGGWWDTNNASAKISLDAEL